MLLKLFTFSLSQKYHCNFFIFLFFSWIFATKLPNILLDAYHVGIQVDCNTCQDIVGLTIKPIIMVGITLFLFSYLFMLWWRTQ